MSFPPRKVPTPPREDFPANPSSTMGPGVDSDAVYFLAEVARLLPRGAGNRPVHVSTILRWICRGLQTPDGVVRLEASRVGGRWMVSAAALRKFTERLTHARQTQVPATPASPRPTRAELAEAELRELGF